MYFFILRILSYCIYRGHALVVIRYFYTHGIAAIDPSIEESGDRQEFGHTLCYHVPGSDRAVMPLAGV
jgi:hypothetical protein